MELRFRQVHLDFHTSEHIGGIGTEFDPDRFVSTLRRAAVDSVTCFSRCHHGWIYHETKFPYRHPHLATNLLEQQIRACHAADIRVPIYITVGWDDLMARLHTEWTEMDENGHRCGRPPLGKYGWVNMDFASPYVDYVIEQTQEVCDLFGDEVDGLFFDILFQQGVHGAYCIERFRELGWDPADVQKQREMRELLVAEVTDRLYGAVREKNRSCSVFFNAGHVGPQFRRLAQNVTHLEVESLPTGGWGYMHFPITSRYARTLGIDFLGMTGKFSEMWGHFNSYKNQAALEYECFQALAQGGKCSIGDQLHPRGELDSATYDLIGSVYRKVEEVEPWCVGARAVAEIAVVSAEPYVADADRINPHNLGAARMLMEGRHQFDLVDMESDWTSYALVVLPDVIPLDDAVSAKVADYVARGGSVLASGHSALPACGAASGPLSSVVEEVIGDLTFSPDFMRVKGGDGTDLVMYERGVRVKPAAGAEVVATVSEPYFERAWDHFCSHAHTPVDHATDIPAVLHEGRIVYFAHPIFETYAKHSMSMHRDVVLKAIELLLPQPLIKVEGPKSLQATITRQDSRHIVHLLHYIPERRGLNFDVVEDPMPVAALTMRVRVPATRATSVPDGQSLSVVSEGDYAVVSVPPFSGHQMVCLESA